MNDLIKEFLRIEEDSEISSKRHFNQAKMYEDKHCILGLPLAILASLASLSAFSEYSWGAIAAGILSLLVAVLTAVNAFLVPGEKAQIHNQAGSNYLSLRNRTRIFRTVELEQKNSDEQIKMLLELNFLRDELNKNSPQTSNRAFVMAIEGKKAGETSYEADVKNADDQ